MPKVHGSCSHESHIRNPVAMRLHFRLASRWSHGMRVSTAFGRSMFRTALHSKRPRRGTLFRPALDAAAARARHRDFRRPDHRDHPSGQHTDRHVPLADNERSGDRGRVDSQRERLLRARHPSRAAGPAHGADSREDRAQVSLRPSDGPLLSLRQGQAFRRCGEGLARTLRETLRRTRRRTARCFSCCRSSNRIQERSWSRYRSRSWKKSNARATRGSSGT